MTKGKAKVLSVVKLLKIESLKDPMVLPIGKRTTKEKEGALQVPIRIKEDTRG